MPSYGIVQNKRKLMFGVIDYSHLLLLFQMRYHLKNFNVTRKGFRRVFCCQDIIVLHVVLK